MEDDLQDLHDYIENYLSEWLKTTSLADVKPSAYSWVFPNELQNGQGISYIDKQASLGTFPTLVSLAPALVYALMFGVVRMVLHHLLFKVRVRCIMIDFFGPISSHATPETYFSSSSYLPFKFLPPSFAL